MKPATTTTKPSSTPKPHQGLKIRTMLKAGDGPTPGARFNHNEKLVSR